MTTQANRGSLHSKPPFFRLFSSRIGLLALSFFLGVNCCWRLEGAACSAAASGLVAWWPGDGNTTDLVGTNNGILQGGATATGIGLVGSAFAFDGTNGYVQFPDSTVFHPSNL